MFVIRERLYAHPVGAVTFGSVCISYKIPRCFYEQRYFRYVIPVVYQFPIWNGQLN